METTTDQKKPVRLSASAVRELKRILAEESREEGAYLRIGAKGGGCSGLSYVLAFDVKTERDVIHNIDGVECIINPAHLIYLADMEVDWEGGLSARGFIFKNPNAAESCGCGTSFAV